MKISGVSTIRASKFKEKLSCKIRRILVRYLTSYKSKVRAYGEIVGEVYDYVTDEFGHVEIYTSGSILIFSADNQVSCLLSLDSMGRQASLIVDELGDLYGVSRALKKFLEERGYHIYYSEEPIERAGKYIAVGVEQIRQLDKLVGKSTNSGNSGGSKNDLH